MRGSWKGSLTPATRAVAVVAALMLALGSAGVVVAYETGTTLGGTTTTVNAGSGYQTDPHLDGNLVAYTNQVTGGTEIHYFDFATSADLAIPVTVSTSDYLSDVSGSTVVFTRVEAAKKSIWSFDTTTAGPAVELDPLADSNRLGAAIGATTVAWQDLGLAGSSEIVAYDLVTHVSVRLTDDLLVDRSPAVSPDGSVIAWEKCATSVSPCDIWQATRTGGSWGAASLVASTGARWPSPDTNGTLVVYGADRAGNANGADIYWKSVAGGAEGQLPLAGDQQNPNISGSVIAFEGRDLADPSPNWDIYLYDLSTSTLYRLTNTPDLDETLNDISVSGTQARVVWAVLEPDGLFGSTNVYGYTFTLTSPTSDTTSPVVTITSPVNGATYVQGQVVAPAWTATDPDDATETLTITAPATVDTSTVGQHTYTVTAADPAGNIGSASVTYTVPFASPGIMQPINPDGSSIFKGGSTIPLRFTLTDAAGLPVTGLAPRLCFSMISNGVLGTEVEAVSTSQATTGNTFRETSPGVYLFNLSTKTMASGTYQVRIELGNGAIMYGRFSLT